MVICSPFGYIDWGHQQGTVLADIVPVMWILIAHGLMNGKLLHLSNKWDPLSEVWVHVHKWQAGQGSRDFNGPFSSSFHIWNRGEMFFDGWWPMAMNFIHHYLFLIVPNLAQARNQCPFLLPHPCDTQPVPCSWILAFTSSCISYSSLFSWKALVFNTSEKQPWLSS